MARVAVVIPWRPTGCPHRERALHFVMDRYLARTSWRVVTAEGPAGPWRKGAAASAGVAAAAADIVVIADADAWCDGTIDAVAHVARNGGWAIPHRHVCRLTLARTAELLDGERDASTTGGFVEAPYVGVIGGGIVVLPAELYARVPIDPRFAGWGGEDDAWGYALLATAGRPWRGTDPLLHLWHPPADRRGRGLGSVETEALRRRYAAARRSRSRMAALIEEAIACSLTTC